MDDGTFGDWLKRERLQRRVTQKRMQSEAGISTTHLSKIENGHILMPEKTTRDRIHRVLGTSDEDLVAEGLLTKIVADGETHYFVPAGGSESAVSASPKEEGRIPQRIIQALSDIDWSSSWRVEYMLDAIRGLRRMDEQIKRVIAEEGGGYE